MLVQRLKNKKSGFTLIEMVIVTLIIFILLLFGINIIDSAKSNARRAKCSSNLKQIYQCFLMYLEDHHDIIPLSRGIDETGGEFNSLRADLSEYTDNEDIFICPSDPREDLDQNGSYDWRAESLRSIRFSQITNKATKIIMGDFRSGWHDRGFRGLDRIASWVGIDSDSGVRRINVLFADGHVEWLTEEEWQTNIEIAVDN